jgi:hypothetical protein
MLRSFYVELPHLPLPLPQLHQQVQLKKMIVIVKKRIATPRTAKIEIQKEHIVIIITAKHRHLIAREVEVAIDQTENDQKIVDDIQIKKQKQNYFM